MPTTSSESLLLQMIIDLADSVNAIRGAVLNLAESPAFSNAQKAEVLRLNAEFNVSIGAMMENAKNFNAV